MTEIDNLTFQKCTSLQSINIPNSVKTIGIFAFFKCTSLQSIHIPNSVTTIGNLAFLECTSLKSIIIPNSVTTIGRRALGECTSLQSIFCRIKSLKKVCIDNETFTQYNYDSCTLFVPLDTIEEYRQHPVFGQFKQIEIEHPKLSKQKN
ncbi:MAG: leucine-rich repeat domain-containing protein [Prevotella sp.]|nr:leucine-rich repeat domain-containing protein [Prevotella sp.]